MPRRHSISKSLRLRAMSALIARKVCNRVDKFHSLRCEPMANVRHPRRVPEACQENDGTIDLLEKEFGLDDARGLRQRHIAAGLQRIVVDKRSHARSKAGEGEVVRLRL